MDELKLCPFCGGPAQVRPDTIFTGTGEPISIARVECANELECGVTNRWRGGHEAIRQWNRRAPLDADRPEKRKSNV